MQQAERKGSLWFNKKTSTTMKTINAIIIATMLLLLGGTAHAQSAQQQRLTNHVYFLASDSLRGREAGSTDAAKAAAYIAQQFEEIGIEPYFEGGWYQGFEYAGRSCKNVVGIIHGADTALKHELIVIGAHYDHLGVGRNGKIYNGADDNASGTATIIEMARILKDKPLKRSVMIAAFDAEEKGLHGSAALAKRLDVSNVKLMMSIDMVGWLHKGKALQLNGAATIVDGKTLLNQTARRMQLKVDVSCFETSLLTATDTRSFAKKNVPTLAVTTGLKSPYHKPEDDAELIDYEGLDQITNYLAEVTEQLANAPSLQASGRIAPVHSGSRRAFSIGPTASVVNGRIAFPDAAFDGRSRYGFEVGLGAQLRLIKHLSLEAKVLYAHHNAKLPDANNLYNSYLPLHQEAVMVPAGLLLRMADEFGIDLYCGLGGYYGRVLKASISGQSTAAISTNQYGLAWSVGMEFGRLRMGCEWRYQLNPLFVGEGMPNAKHRTAVFNVGWMF